MSTVVAVPTEPRVVCPSWCTVPEAEHVAELPNWEGFVIHQGSIAMVADREVSLSTSAYIDGTIDAQDPPMVWLGGHNMNATEARELAEALHDAADRLEEHP